VLGSLIDCCPLFPPFHPTQENLRRRLLFASEADMLLRVAGHPGVVRCLGFCAGSCPEDWEYTQQQREGDCTEDDIIDAEYEEYGQGGGYSGMQGGSTSTTQSFQPLGRGSRGARAGSLAWGGGPGKGRSGVPAKHGRGKRGREPPASDCGTEDDGGGGDDAPLARRSHQRRRLDGYNYTGSGAPAQLEAKAKPRGKLLVQSGKTGPPGAPAGGPVRRAGPPAANLPCCIAMDYAGGQCSNLRILVKHSLSLCRSNTRYVFMPCHW
jgi:hypothetical protein